MPSLSGLLRVAACVIGLCIPAFVGHTLHRQRAQALATAETRAANTARVLEQHAARTVESVDAYLRAVVSLVGPRAGEIAPEVVHAALRQQLSHSRHLNNVIVVDRDGHALVEAEAFPARPLDVGDRDYFQTLKTTPGTGLVVGLTVVGRLTGRRVIPVARRMENADGSFAGVVQVTLDADAFQAAYDTIDNGLDGTLSLWRADGTLLVRAPHKPEVVGRSFASSENYRRHVPARDTKPFWSVGVTDGVERVIAFGFLDGFPLYVSTALGRADALAGWQASAITQACVAGGLTIVLVIALLLLAREVRRRQVADAEIRASEARYRLLAEHSSDLIALKPSFDGPRAYASPSTREIVGYDPDEFLTLAIAGYLHPEDRDRVAAEYASLTAEKPLILSTHRVRHKAGHYAWLETTFRLINAGTPEAAVLVRGRDVTARREAEARLAASEARYRLLSEGATDMVTQMDASGRRLYVSPACRELLGYEPDALLGTRPQDAIHPDDAASLASLLEALASGRRDRGTHINRLRHRAGHWVWVEASLRRMQDEDGRFAGCVASVRDITARKAAEAAAAESEARYREVLKASQDTILGQLAEGVIVTDTAGRITLVNEAAATIHGVSRLDVEPDNYSDTYHLFTEDGRPYPPHDLPLARAVRGETVTDARWRIERPDGTGVHAIGSARPVRGRDGRQVGAVLTLRDNTGREAAERALRDLNATLSERVAERTSEVEIARAEAERASAAKSDFLAAMSHEIRKPLNGILGYADLLLDETALGPPARRHAERIQGAGAALLTVVNDILDFSKIEAGQIEFHPEPFALAGLIDNATSIVRASAERKGLRLSVEADPALPPFVVGDQDRLRQVLLNLLNNAIKFTRAGDVVLLAEARGTEDGRARLRFAVRDTGIGIPPAKQHLLFERFSQIDGSIQREFGGTGLGLAICKRLVELMDGEIGVESEEGRGSTFWFGTSLPVAARAAGPVAAEAKAPVRAGRRLLLAEDIPLNQELACAILHKAGYDVDVVESGEEAVRAVQAQGYDLVLMDVQMPGMDGLTATRLIRALDHPAASVPIVALTANVLPQQAAAFRAAGMCDHVGKPFKRDALIAAIERWALGSGDAALPIEAGGLDRSILDEMVELLGQAGVDRLLGVLSEELGRRLGADGEVPDRDRLARDAHAMVSASGTLGFRALSELCRDIEAACQADQDCEALLARLHDVRRATIRQIELLRAA